MSKENTCDAVNAWFKEKTQGYPPWDQESNFWPFDSYFDPMFINPCDEGSVQCQDEPLSNFAV